MGQTQYIFYTVRNMCICIILAANGKTLPDAMTFDKLFVCHLKFGMLETKLFFLVIPSIFFTAYENNFEKLSYR